MAYSRWSNSKWYTYWCTSSGRVKDTQRFAICTIGYFTYKDLVSNLSACLKAVDGDSELMYLMLEFIGDMDFWFDKNGKPKKISFNKKML